MKRFAIRLLASLFVLLWCVTSQAQPRNIILFVGDGMGFEHVKATRLYMGGPLSFESFPYSGQVQTSSANSSVTDSAAAATAMATGIKVNNGVISVALPGDGSELLTLVEDAMQKGKMTGLITTTYLTHATPAAFGAHETSRNNLNEIASDYLNQTLPNVLFGGGGNGLSVESTESAGYEVAVDSTGFAELQTEHEHLSAQFGTDHLPYKYDYLGTTYPFPSLGEMTAKALETMENDPEGFFLLVEGGRIDHACHSNMLERAIHETIDFSNAVQTAIDWAAGRSDTLIIVTADHETGGLLVLTDNGALNYPSVSWSTTGHTGVNVPLYAWGVNAKYFNKEIDNTDIFKFCLKDSEEVSEPIPRINANGSSEPLTVKHGDHLTVQVSMAPGTYNGQNGDWWILAHTPITSPHDWYYFDLSSGWLPWKPEKTVTYQGPLFNLSTYEVLNISAELPLGTYTFYFGVDVDMNGVLDMDQIFYESVRISILP